MNFPLKEGKDLTVEQIQKIMKYKELKFVYKNYKGVVAENAMLFLRISFMVVQIIIQDKEINYF